MEELYFTEKSVDGAWKYIIFLLKCHLRNRKVIYFDGWNGLGAVPVLRSIAQELRSTKAHPPELCFDKIIYLDCSLWESRRMMQRKIAEELKLDHTTMKVFDMQDEEDDFNGVDRSSRDEIQSVGALIYKSLKDINLMTFFINGSDDEIDITGFGIPVAKYHSSVVLWTFNRRLLTVHESHQSEIKNKLRGTHLFFEAFDIHRLSASDFSVLLNEEVTSKVARHPCLQAVNLRMVTNCCLYKLFLHYNFHITTGFDWTAHASNYWMCASIIEGDATSSDIVTALQKEICWVCDGPLLQELFHKFTGDPKFPFFSDNYYYNIETQERKNYQIRPYDWVCITSKYLTVPDKDMKTILESSSSLFVLFERCNDPQPGLPNGLFKHCSNLVVLTLSFCAFSFESPPFLVCQTIKFLGLEHCTDNKASKANYPTNWAHLHSLWVLDLRNTNWDAILSEEKLKIMDNLTELNIEGSRCWQYLSQLKNILPCLQRLRIINPIHQAAAPTDTIDSFMDNKMLQILDLSGNKSMKCLPTSITNASNLEVLVLDGCDEIENVVLPNEFLSSLRSFSFDGYGSIAQWKSMIGLPPESSRPKRPYYANKVDVKTMKISLQGFKQLQNSFLRGLPNLEELDLSGSTIKVLDFNTMVVDVPNLKRLFLLGYENLCAIKWVGRQPGRPFERQPELELLCIDTRPGWSTGCARPSLHKHKSYRLQVYAIIVDARLVRSLYSEIQAEEVLSDSVYFSIHITKSDMGGGAGGFVHEEVAHKETVGATDQPDVVLAVQYDDVSKKIIDDVPSPMEAFPEPPPHTRHHIEIGDGSRIMKNEMEKHDGLDSLLTFNVESLNVHDSSKISRLPGGYWYTLRWCRVSRCPNLDTFFSPSPFDHNNNDPDIMGKYIIFGNLQHLHLCFCPRLRFMLPARGGPSFPNLRTLHIINCGDLEHAFVVDNESHVDQVPIHGVPFPKLTTIHLYDLPKLRQIISEHRMLVPALESIGIRGCFALLRLPSLEGRVPGVKKPMVEMEKDVWNALEWDGLTADHHPDLFESPVHSRHYRRLFLRGTVLR